jgi:predicted nucleic acid-binding protein
VPSVAVVDASVAVKWVLLEPDRERSLRLLDDYQSGALRLIAPEFLLAEIASVLAKRCRRRELTPVQARESFGLFRVYMPVLVALGGEIDSALELSILHSVPIYDCLYLALALERGCELVTADRKFHAAVGRSYPGVRLLSTI